MTARPRMELMIDELVFIGFSSLSGPSTANAMNEALAARLARADAAAWQSRDTSIEHLDGGAIAIRPGSGLTELGHGIAHAVHEAVAGSFAAADRSGIHLPAGARAER